MKTHGVGDDKEEDESQLQWRKKRMATTTLSSAEIGPTTLHQLERWRINLLINASTLFLVFY